MNGNDELKRRKGREKMESKKKNVRVKKWWGRCESVGRVLRGKIKRQREMRAGGGRKGWQERSSS